MFSQSPYEAYLDTVKDFRHYNLARFSNPWSGGERRHPDRTKEIEQFYQSTSPQQRQSMKRELILNFHQEGQTVVFLIPKNKLAEHQNQLTNEIQLELIRDWQEGKWGIYRVKLEGKS